ncbi:MAG: hypothetical protein ACXVLQ_15910 [Bacteriovorax sp.]
MNTHKVLFFQGLYYFLTAFWPIFHIYSFEKVSGPKTDHWLVYTVALLLIASSLVFLYSGLGDAPVPIESIILSVSNCLALVLIEVIFVTRGKIWKIYLMDALVEIIILISLLVSLYRPTIAPRPF